MGRSAHNMQIMHDQRDPTQQYRARQLADRQPKQSPAAQGDPHGQRRDPHGAQQKKVHHGAQESIPHAAKAEAEKPQIQQYITHTKWIGQPESRQRAV